jgi:hypothetical protein
VKSTDKMLFRSIMICISRLVRLNQLLDVNICHIGIPANLQIQFHYCKRLYNNFLNATEMPTCMARTQRHFVKGTLKVPYSRADRASRSIHFQLFLTLMQIATRICLARNPPITDEDSYSLTLEAL